MEYMGTSQAAEKWNVAQATVCKYCREHGKEIGAEQDAPGRPWRIPQSAENPFDKKK